MAGKRISLALLFLSWMQLFPASAPAGQLLYLSADKAVYEEGERALFRAKLAARPADDEFEFHVSLAAPDGSPVPLSVEAATGDYTGVGPAFGEPGAHAFTARAWLQHRETAASFLQAIALYEADLRAIDEALGQTQDPAARERLLSERAATERSLVKARAALARHRKAAGQPVTISLIVQ